MFSACQRSDRITRDSERAALRIHPGKRRPRNETTDVLTAVCNSIPPEHRRPARAPISSQRVKRVIYPAGFRWSKDMKAIVGTDLCMHAHVGFLARGQVHIQYADGCTVEFAAPQVVVIEPGDDGWVVGDEAAVLIEFDFEGETVSKLGMQEAQRHGCSEQVFRASGVSPPI